MLVKIYVLKHPETLEVRYIGRTKNKLNARLNGHLSKARKNKVKTHKDNWLLSLKERPIIEQIEEVEGWTESYKVEQFLIKDYLEKGYDLVNLHDRGEGGVNRNISIEQRQKISKSVKKLHEEGKLNCGRKKITLFDLEGNRINTFASFKECASYIGVSDKHMQRSVKRNAKRIRNYQHIVGEILHNIPPYINPRIINARVKPDELLGTPEEDNQQPS